MAPSDQYGGGELSDPASMDYGDEYVDYEGVYDGDGTYEGSSGLDQSLAGGADGNKGRGDRRKIQWDVIIDMGTLNRPLIPMYSTCDVM
jgi:hypothetical protein